MSFLTDAFRDTIAKDNLGGESEYQPTYKSGIDIFDYHNGRIESEEEKIGVNGGKITSIIGRSGTGKSSMAVKLATEIVKDYDEGQIIHMDFENATNRARIAGVSGWSEEMIANKYILLNSKIYSETFYKLVKATEKLKLAEFDKLKIDTGKKNRKGEKIYILPPTVFIVDSWASMVPKDLAEEEELSGQMSATATARSNNSIIKRITGSLEEANITLIVVNHITQKIEIGKKVLI